MFCTTVAKKPNVENILNNYDVCKNKIQAIASGGNCENFFKNISFIFQDYSSININKKTFLQQRPLQKTAANQNTEHGVHSQGTHL